MKKFNNAKQYSFGDYNRVRLKVLIGLICCEIEIRYSGREVS